MLRLRAPRNRVSRRAITLWTLDAAIGWLVLLAIQLVPYFLVSDASPWQITGLVATVVVGVAHTLVMPRWRYRVHRWEATPEAVYTLSGWVTQEWRIAPVSRIQTVDTKRGPLQQLLRLSTVTVTTASAAGPVEIAGLDHAEAVRLAEELTSTTQATPGDAT
ncbi:PH domain-containing protein [Actinosynnema pretiosum subsp. pretiosum]|uniref:PH domain-containing protein n=1 Tax=Actinosynnema pretiosum subsp. pretiosum TaxID=103721 RepID=A0AA45LD91_9PSEU|nr:transmembrane protein, distant homology with ydbS [Actinosynnema pretiosum subsp. pretiosum]QUF07942.1 PH domain-containing protein [Actinosynnema pretiosum subsp. pretiosum]